MFLRKVILSISILCILPSCMKDEPGLEQYYENRDEGIAFLEENGKKDGIVTTDSGLQYEALTPGEGENTSEFDIVRFRYTVSSIEGVEYFSNETTESEDIPYSRLNGFNEYYIREGLSLMNVGSAYKFYVPYQLAYGEFQYGEIVPFTALVVELELLENFFLDNAKKEAVTVTESGLQYEIIEQGTGENAGEDSDVSVHYHGTFLNGDVFDSSVDRGTPSDLNVDCVIQGFSEGLQLMNTGAKYKLYIPYDLAYGVNGTSGIPGYTPLIFEIELIEIY